MNLNLVIIGGGPNGLYTLNSILNLIFKKIILNLVIFLFDKNGNFGYGWAHSPFQANTSMLNRISGQLSFYPDNLNLINFHEWCKLKLNLTKDFKYNKSIDEFPLRKLYGESLKDIFNNNIQEILKNNKVYLIKNYIYQIIKNNLGLYKIFCYNLILNNIFDFIIIATGHQEQVNNFYLSKKLFNVIEYINFAYPLFDIKNWIKKNIIIIGMGLTSIDLILYYTENKIGKFIRFNNKLFYKYSFNEPKKLFVISRTGYFTYSRPHNFKEINLIKYEHYGFFFKKKIIDLIRYYLGNNNSLYNSFVNQIKQIDFDINVFPILYLELKLSYYKILFGYEILSFLIYKLKKKLQQILFKKNFIKKNKILIINYLSNIIDKIIFEIFFKIKIFINKKIKVFINKISCYLFCKRFFSIIFNKNYLFNYSFNLFNKIIFEDYIFNYNFIVNPIIYIKNMYNISNKIKLIKFMEIDRLQSEQGNLDNPYKGCCDDVFRDLRQIIVYAIDLGGITPYSYILMLQNFYSIHNRAANGNCIELMEKIEALIISKLLNINYSKSNIQIYNNSIYLNNLNSNFNVNLINSIIDAKLHNFCVKHTKNKLFKKLIFYKISSIWIYSDYLKIKNNIYSFNLNKNFQLINIFDENEFIFCLGQPSEGILFFQNGSIRPLVNHHIINDLLMCFFKIQQEILKF